MPFHVASRFPVRVRTAFNCGHGAVERTRQSAEGRCYRPRSWAGLSIAHRHRRTGRPLTSRPPPVCVVSFSRAGCDLSAPAPQPSVFNCPAALREPAGHPLSVPSVSARHRVARRWRVLINRRSRGHSTYLRPSGLVRGRVLSAHRIPGFPDLSAVAPSLYSPAAPGEWAQLNRPSASAVGFL